MRYGKVTIDISGKDHGYFADIKIFDENGTEIKSLSGNVDINTVLSISNNKHRFTFTGTGRRRTKAKDPVSEIVLPNSFKYGDILGYSIRSDTDGCRGPITNFKLIKGCREEGVIKIPIENGITTQIVVDKLIYKEK